MQALLGDLSLVKSDAPHDWLGRGTYFWESDKDRALEWANYKHRVGLCPEPFVVGAIIDLGNCFDLTVRENLDFLGTVFESYAEMRTKAGLAMPENKDSIKGASQNKVMRHLDCAVFNYLHQVIEEGGQPPFDTIRGLFVEGDRAYPGSEVYKLTHVQIAVCNDDCIRGIFLPR